MVALNLAVDRLLGLGRLITIDHGIGMFVGPAFLPIVEGLVKDRFIVK